MIKSMTGYGKEVLIENSREYQVEIKSVNHRYLDISVKSHKSISYLDDEIKKIISKKIRRGKIDVTILFENNSSIGKQVKINDDIAKMYIDELRRLASKENLESNIEVTEISKLPDVLKIQNVVDDESIKNEVISVVTKTIDNLIKMKKTEGNQISIDLNNRISVINAKIKEISNLSTRLIEEYVVKLEDRIKELLKTKDVNESRLAEEVVIFADKCSVEEEITRLNSHILQFQELLNEEDAIGKKLDFIIQEMNRETNTIGSKANKLEITKNVIDIKSELENIREQVQNIE